MRGADHQQSGMFSYISAERRVPKDHPLRAIRAMADAALRELGPCFATLYASYGRPSIAPEKLLRALLLQILYTLRSERQLMEQLDYNLLFRWFVGLSMDDPVWDVTVFTKNRERLLAGEVAQAFFNAVLGQARTHGLLSAEHFTVDGTLIEAWASTKSFKPKAGADGNRQSPDDPSNPSVDFHGERRSNQTHQSTTDPEARLYKKSKGGEYALLYRARRDGEPQRACGQLPADSGSRHGRAQRGSRDGRGGPGLGTRDPGGGQGLRTQRVRARAARSQRHPAHCAEAASAIDRRTSRYTGYAISQPGASGSRRSSAGSKPWAVCARPITVGPGGSAGYSPWRWPLTTWCGCATCCPHRHKATGEVRAQVPSDAINTLSGHLPAIPIASD